jgi:hypothetical protein
MLAKIHSGCGFDENMDYFTFVGVFAILELFGDITPFASKNAHRCRIGSVTLSSDSRSTYYIFGNINNKVLSSIWAQIKCLKSTGTPDFGSMQMTTPSASPNPYSHSV